MTQQEQIQCHKSQQYQLLQRYINNLLKRQNLCNNTYLYKQMKKQLIIPLYIFLEQRTIQRYNFNKQTIIKIITQTGQAQILNNRSVRIIQHPTVKISSKQSQVIKILQSIFEEKQKKYQLSKRSQTNAYINLTVFNQTIEQVEKLINNISKDIVYQRVKLIDDIKIGVQRIRKLKFQHAQQRYQVGTSQYSFNFTPHVFIRKALQSSDQESNSPITKALGKYTKKVKPANTTLNNTTATQQFPLIQ